MAIPVSIAADVVSSSTQQEDSDGKRIRRLHINNHAIKSDQNPEDVVR